MMLLVIMWTVVVIDLCCFVGLYILFLYQHKTSVKVESFLAQVFIFTILLCTTCILMVFFSCMVYWIQLLIYG